MPKISVIMGVYNAEKRIEKAVKSILQQSFNDFELIICDDGSTDHTHEVLIQLQKTDSRIKIITNKKNRQLSYTLNRCLKVSQGIYIARMDDDDYSYPNRFKEQVEFLDYNPSYAIVGTSIAYYDEYGIWGHRKVKGEVSCLDLLKGNTFVHPSVMIRAAALKEISGYNCSNAVKRTEDYDLWLRLYKHRYKGYNLPNILLKYYENSNSTKKRKYKYRIFEYQIRKEIYNAFHLSKCYLPYVWKPLLVGLLPGRCVVLWHKQRKK